MGDPGGPPPPQKTPECLGAGPCGERSSCPGPAWSGRLHLVDHVHRGVGARPIRPWTRGLSFGIDFATKACRRARPHRRPFSTPCDQPRYNRSAAGSDLGGGRPGNPSPPSFAARTAASMASATAFIGSEAEDAVDLEVHAWCPARTILRGNVRDIITSELPQFLILVAQDACFRILEGDDFLQLMWGRRSGAVIKLAEGSRHPCPDAGRESWLPERPKKRNKRPPPAGGHRVHQGGEDQSSRRPGPPSRSRGCGRARGSFATNGVRRTPRLLNGVAKLQGPRRGGELLGLLGGERQRGQPRESAWA